MTKEEQKYNKDVQDFILNTISKQTGISCIDLKGKSRKREILIPRQFYMSYALKYTTSSYRAIGELVNRDGATVRHAKKRLDDPYFYNEQEKDIYIKLKKHMDLIPSENYSVKANIDLEISNIKRSYKIIQSLIKKL